MIIEEQAPLRCWGVLERYCPWITTQLKASARTKDRLRKSAVKVGSEILMIAYCHIRNAVSNKTKHQNDGTFWKKFGAARAT